MLADHDADSLTALLRQAGGSPSAARAAAGRALHHVFGARRHARAVQWDAEILTGLGIGAWAHATLLAFDPTPSLVLRARVPAADGTLRLALRTRDGGLVESVLIPGATRTTLCLSSQVGCARACVFCETGRLGLVRQLTAAEIVDQARLAQAVLDEETSGAVRAPLRNLVFMGMGEPFDNLPAVLRAIALLTDARTFRFAPSRVTVSTVGVADRIAAFFRGTRAQLAVSLNAPDDARRLPIMPITARFPMAALKRAIVDALPPRRRVFFEYVLFDGYNDAPRDAEILAEYVAGVRCRVNVIPANPGPTPGLRPPRPARVAAFVGRLSALGVVTLVRQPRGRDVGGACGQLAGAARDLAT